MKAFAYRPLGLLAAASVLVASAFAAPIAFRIGGGSPAQQLAQVESETEFETFTGTTAKVSGNLTFDPAKRTGGGKVVVDVASIKTGIDLRDDHMRSPTWLDAAKHPTITFQTTRVRWVKDNTYNVVGNFTMHGVTRPVTTTATVRYMKESASTRNAGFKGDVLQVRSQFKLKLSDYKVTIPPQAKGKVAETVTIKLTVYGQSGS